MNAYKYGKMSRLYYMYSANFMKKSGFYLNNGKRYMNIYLGYRAKEKICRNKLRGFKVRKDVLRKQAEQVVLDIQNKQLKKETLWMKTNTNT